MKQTDKVLSTHKKIRRPLKVKSTELDDFPIRASYIYDNIPPENSEDIIWEHLIDTESEIEQYEIGVALTQTYQYTKLHKAPIILAKWQGMRTKSGPEFRIGLGNSIPDSKITSSIMTGNFKDGVIINSTLSIESVKLGCINGDLAVQKDDGKWYAIQIGDEVEQIT